MSTLLDKAAEAMGGSVVQAGMKVITSQDTDARDEAIVDLFGKGMIAAFGPIGVPAAIGMKLFHRLLKS